MSDTMTREEAHAAARLVIEGLLDAAGVSAPPVDAVALARVHLRLPEPAVKKPKGPPPDEETRQLLAAQQVGDHLKTELLRRLGVGGEGPRPLLGESLTNLVAHRLLVPDGWLADEARASGFDLEHLKRVFRTASHELIAWRLLDLPEPSLITIVDNGRVTRRRANLWRAPRELSEAERECQQYAHEHCRPHRVRHDQWTVWGWPVHRVDWKREVLRAVVDGAEG